MMNKTILSVLLFIFFSPLSLSQNKNNQPLSVGNNIIENYSNSFLNRPTSVWSVLRSSQNKMIYYGTFDGILEYNGKDISSISINGSIEEELETSYVRKIIEDVEQITMGQQIIKLNFSADYVVNQRLNIKLFYDKVITNPFISTTFPSAITNAGFSLRFTLAG